MRHEERTPEQVRDEHAKYGMAPHRAGSGGNAVLSAIVGVLMVIVAWRLVAKNMATTEEGVWITIAGLALASGLWIPWVLEWWRRRRQSQ